MEKTYNFSGFTSLDISHGCSVVVQQSDTYSVSVTIDDNLAQYLDVHQNGSTVSVGLQDMDGYSTSKFKAVLKCPELTGCMGSDGSKISAEPFTTNKNVSLSLSGGSSFNGNWSCGNLSAMFSGGSTADLIGDCKYLTLDFSGGSVGHMVVITKST